MKHWFAVLTLLICVALSVPTVFAVPIDDEGNTAPEYLDCGTEEELETLSEEGSEVPTVNLSDASIEAIADAVAQSYSATVTNKDGMTYAVPSVLESVWSDYEYKVRVAGNGIYWVLANEPIIFNDPAFEGNALVYWSRSGSAWQKIGEGDLTNLRVQGSVTWSNTDLYNEVGKLKYETDVPAAFTVTFVSGFEDLVFDPQTTDDFSLPTPVYDGYIFLGWYTDPECLFAFGGSVEQDMTLYAKWTAEPPMTFFTSTLFGSMTVLLECEPILYLVSLMALFVIVGIIKSFISSRI